jgi:hypothetical protein
MDIMLFGFAVDLTLWALAGYLIGHFGKPYLPRPLQDPRLTMAAAMITGVLATMLTYRSWAIYPGPW